MALEEYFELPWRVGIKTFMLHGLGIVTALLLALQVRKALITRAKVSCYITFILVDANIIVAETYSYGRVFRSNNVLDRCLQVHIPWEGNHPRGLYKGVYRAPSLLYSEFDDCLIALWVNI